jgi:catechol 2,3-dioxygenase-like lactoylglutathione lyase family enzyme
MAGIRGLAEIVIWVQDRDRSLAFYHDLLGLPVISPPHLPGVFLRVGEEGTGVPQQIVLVPRAAGATSAAGSPADRGLHASPADRVLHHIGLELAADRYDAERERLTAAGLQVRGGTHPFLPVEAFYVDDPDGNEVEFVRRTT